MKKFYLLLAFAGLITSCKTNQLYLSVVEPAPVTIPADIKKVGVINRSAATEETKAIDVADKILSLEGANLDKEGSQESIKVLSEELLNNNRFTDVIPLNDIDFRTPKLGVFPAPLSWDIVDQICKSTGTDAIFSLEKFDTDTRVSYSTRKVDIKTPLGTVPGLEHTATMETLVKTGWRIYDPASRAILDEFLYDESIVSSGRGVNPLTAAAALMGRKEAVKQVGNKAGHGYAMRIIPFELRVMRDYYVKGSDRFKVAKRKAQMGKWDEAGELWKAELQNPKMKIASRATYNMAIISEINGDLEGALKWAQKSYEDYNNKLGREYVRILENRRYKNQVLAEQEKR